MSAEIIQFVPRPNPDRHGLTDFYVDPTKLYKGADWPNTVDTAPCDQLANELMARADFDVSMDAAIFGLSVTRRDESGAVSRVDLHDIYTAPDDDCA